MPNNDDCAVTYDRSVNAHICLTHCQNADYCEGN